MLISEKGFAALLSFVGGVDRTSAAETAGVVATAPTQPKRRIEYGTKCSG
jgi:hypothetical protein